ncbi:Utp14-domain-containing protein [Tothia fuscella]|uniref:Utp14-domain-containing protein n=1 Tax=Tothia fuscella TaxID=1048955 RepID=A0A9P4NG11_9PEZI|nr:Utp14-domain-containing protein [Tothia fuscella]
MPPRISRSNISKDKPKSARNKSSKRSLQAFSIAEAQNGPDNLKIRKTRLGETEDDGPRQRKRARSQDAEDSEDDGAPSRKKVTKGRFDELDLSEGSDSEGNRWKVGVVAEDDDSDLDSDEAFGSSDEERFEGFTFRGSSSNNLGGRKGKGKVKTRGKRAVEERGDLDLEEEELSVGEDEEDEDSLGEDAVDLATMLDNYSGSEEEAKAVNRNGDSDDSSSEDEDDEDDDTSSESISDIEEADDEDQLAKLEDLVYGLQPKDAKAKRKQREADPHEDRAPSASGLVSSEKFDIMDFIQSDPQIKKMSKQLGTIPKPLKKDPKLAVALPKRQKDKLERIVANEKAKETLGRWVDTVKQNRRADHISFPIVDPETAKPHGSRHLVPTNQSAPMNDLEKAINNIMVESGLTTGNAEEEEDRIREFEELTTNKMPLEEVQARRAELRKARDLLFREEIRSKRVKKIKSKAYRRVHRKEREKLEAQDRDAFLEGGESDIDDEDRDKADRRRAEERMGAKHRDSKWAKQMKKSGRSVWDEDARSGVSEMAQKNEELRRRIEGKEVRNDDSEAEATFTSSESEDEADRSDLDGDDAEFQRLQRQISRANGVDEHEGSGPGSRLSSMKFMQQAEAARKARNDEDVERMRKELAGEDGSEGEDSEGEETIGRKIFGPTKSSSSAAPQRVTRNEFEAPPASDDEEEFLGFDTPANTTTTKQATTAPSRPTLKGSAQKTQIGNDSAISISANHPKANGKSKKPQPAIPSQALEPELLPGEKHTHPDADGWTTVTYNEDEEEEANHDANDTPTNNALDPTEILRRAFAGEDMEEQFHTDKLATIEDESTKIVDTTLPGWGSWVGEGLSKREQSRNYGRHFTKIDGIKPEQRKDAKLKNVIVNQKRVKKNGVYLAGELPFPFSSKGEYERSMRMPIGGEWNVKSVYQGNTKPRVLVKPGVVIGAMSKPMV